MQKLCEYAQDKSIGVNVNVICDKTGEFCHMIRYCSIEQHPVMTSDYHKYGCKLKSNNGDKMSRRKNPQKQKTILIADESGIEKEIVAKVNFSKKDKTSLQYPLNGNLYNITVEGIYSGVVKIKYKGYLVHENIISVEQL